MPGKIRRNESNQRDTPTRCWPSDRRRCIIDWLDLWLSPCQLHLQLYPQYGFRMHIVDRTLGRFPLNEGDKTVSFLNFHWNANDFSKQRKLIAQKVLGDIIARHKDCIAGAWFFRAKRRNRWHYFGAKFFLIQATLFTITFGRNLLIHWMIRKEKKKNHWKKTKTFRSIFKSFSNIQLWTRLGSRSSAALFALGNPSGCVAENGWYEATFDSGTIRLRSWPLGRLKDIWSCFICGFWIAGMAPLLNNFRATSRASRASTARFGINCFSVSCFGAFNACKAFFCKKKWEQKEDILPPLMAQPNRNQSIDSHRWTRLKVTFFFNFWYFVWSICSSSVRFGGKFM